MSTRAITLKLSLFALATCAWAAAPFATVSATEPFDLNGSRVPNAGVPSWPVTEGDVIATSSGSATIVFRDGSRVEIVRYSKARIERAGSKSVLRLLQGSGKYILASSPRVDLFVLDKPAAAHPTGRGVISTSGANQGRLAAADKDDKDKDGGKDDDHDHKPPSSSPYK